MCGIVGYIGPEDTSAILVGGLKHLEYRGYDSAGVGILYGGKINICRCEGKISKLNKLLGPACFDGRIGIGHTRWATHGRPSEANAHPHYYQGVAVVHNGIIENYVELKKSLKAEGHIFSSETDSEVLAHLFSKFMLRGAGFEEAVRQGLALVRGSYAIAALCEQQPDRIVVARKESPLILGLGKGENFVASDIPAMLRHTREFVFLNDGEIAVIEAQSARISTLEGAPVERAPRHISWDPLMAEKNGYKHFMLKEIFEQPQAIIDTLRGRLREDADELFLDGVNLTAEEVRGFDRMYFVACGTSYYAGLVGEFMIEQLVGIPVKTDIGSEFRYRDPHVNGKTLVVLISQSGETADTLAAGREARAKGAQTLCIGNVVESTLARECDHVLYTHAGPEISVASTKAFTCQLTAIFLLALFLGNARGAIDKAKAHRLMQQMIEVPRLVKQALEQAPAIKAIARKYATAKNFLFLGRGITYPIALEGALKLKETSYIHAEGCPAGEMKHAMIALIDEDMPVMVIAQRDPVYEKILNNIEEVKTRNGRVIAIATAGDSVLGAMSDDILYLPETDPLFAPFVMVIPLQLFAYHVADFKGTDVDQPRNLAKCVCVE